MIEIKFFLFRSIFFYCRILLIGVAVALEVGLYLMEKQIGVSLLLLSLMFVGVAENTHVKKTGKKKKI